MGMVFNVNTSTIQRVTALVGVYDCKSCLIEL